MEALEKLQVVFSAEEQRVANGFRFGIDHLTSLKHLIVQIKCRDVNDKEVSAAEDSIKHAVSTHPNRPRLEVQKLAEQYTFDEDEMDRVTVEDYEDNEGEREIVVEGEATPKLNAQIGEQAHQ
ncbi:unnamed protein product [Urochloa humidicola]